MDLGFVHVGPWELEGSKPQIVLGDYAKLCPALYAFVQGQQVVYVGKTARTLKQRMQNYKTPGSTQRTSTRNHNSIVDSIGNGYSINLYVLKNVDPIEYKGVVINLAAGLEDPLIKLIRPKWNLTGH